MEKFHKIFAVFLIAVIVFSLCGCSVKDGVNSKKLTPVKVSEIKEVNGKMVPYYMGNPYLFYPVHMRYDHIMDYIDGEHTDSVLEQAIKKVKESGFEAVMLYAKWEKIYDGKNYDLTWFTKQFKLAEKYDMPILYSCHPRSRKKLEQTGFELDRRVIRHEPLGFIDYNCLQMNAYVVVSDSGTLPEESAFFTSIGRPFPAICIRLSTERPEALDQGNFVLAGIDEKALLQAVETAIEMKKNKDFGSPVLNYKDLNTSVKVIKLIQSYSGIIEKVVWKEYIE
jgi:UDP-N-acetylglucosamine 2-epimerase (non-hydrolysing)